MRVQRFVTALSVLAMLSPTTYGQTAGLPLDQIHDETLRTNYRQVGLQVIFGDSIRGMVNANKLGWEVFNSGEKGKSRELAYALALQAAAEASLQMDREALWHWEAGQIIMPELREELMSTYREIAAIFNSSPFKDHKSAVAWLQIEGKLLQPGDGGSQPKIIEKATAVTPKKKPGALNGSKVSVTFLVDPEGRTQAPQLDNVKGNELAVYTVLQALMGWRYEPARRDGEAVWAVSSADISFRTQK